ncbi:lipopolysaccharide biosynthesis protein [Actimicrobium antarcticum]|uniref:Lipopolysaccharide biosynthesis protein n=1 Tax=Actimicrobium antarcticum TaxID=1051899 RepID=A0ABP7SKF7_9BURK
MEKDTRPHSRIESNGSSHDNGQHDSSDEMQLSLTDLVVPLWRGRKLILAGALIAMLLGAAVSLKLSKYRSEGFLQFGGAIPLPRERLPGDKEPLPSPGIALADYKRYAAAFGTPGRLDQFITQNKLTGTPEAMALQRTFASKDGITALVQPVYPFTKLDAKELMEQTKDASNNVIGLRINYAAGTPEMAQHLVTLLGGYAMDGIIYLTYSDALRFKHSEITARVTKLDNDIIDLKERLDSYQRQGTALRQIVTRYPDMAGAAGRQPFLVTGDNARYLPPVTHLMSTEVGTSEANEAITTAQREQRQALILRDYYDRAKSVLDGGNSSATMLRSLETIKEEVFKKQDLKDPVVKEVYNTITIDNQKSINLYLEKTRFIAGPSLPESHTLPLSTTLLISLLLGVVLSSLLVYGRNWWGANRQRITS